MGKLIMIDENDMFEDWYEFVKDYTPKSSILPLTKDEEIVLKAISYDCFLQRGYYPDSMPLRPTNFSKEEENIIIYNLKTKIDHILKGNKKFFRANIFSPKDAENCIVKSSDEVLNLFIHSERIFFKSAAIMKEKPMTFIFRDIIQIKEEYRVFVKNGAVIGISQYEDSNVIIKNEPVENIYSIDKSDILKVCTWVECMITTAKVDTAVVDVAKLIDENYCIIELNPFNKVTDKCLLTKYKLYDESYKNVIAAYAITKNSILIIEINNSKILYEEVLEIKQEKLKDISSMILSLKLKKSNNK